MSTNIPNIPKNWIRHSDIRIENGCRPRCKVIRPWNEITPYVVHTAYVVDGEWAYEQGDYCFTMEQAENKYDNRTV
jgi:hypothetical protein